MQLTQESIYARFPWAKSVDVEIDDSDQGFFYDVAPWSFNQAQLNLIQMLLEEVESWFLSRDKPIEIVIVEIKEVQGYIFVEKISGAPEVDEIFDKYRSIYVGE